MDKETVTSLQGNPQMQYFIGLHEFHPEPSFDSSMMVHFRKWFPVEEVAKINEYMCTGKWLEGRCNEDRKDDTDEGDESPLLPSTEGEGENAPRRKGKANPNTSKKEQQRRKKNRGKLI